MKSRNVATWYQIFCQQTSPLTMGSMGQQSTFSEHGLAAYKIKWNHEMQQHSSK